MDAKERDQMLTGLGAAAAKALDDPMRNFNFWHAQREYWVGRLRNLYEERGLGNARAFWAVFWEAVVPLSPPKDSASFLQLVKALATDAGEIFWGHIEDRKRDGGNVFLQILGNTGIGKSSVALGIVEQDKPWKPGQLRQHLTIDRSRIPDMLPLLESLDWLILDDEDEGGGENSATEDKQLRAMEEQTRKSQKHTIVISPSAKKHAAVQIQLRAFAWSKDGRLVATILYVMDLVLDVTLPLGVVIRPFCSDAAYAEYDPIKDENVERAIRAAFDDSKAIVRFINRISDDPECQAFLVGRRKKPALKDFKMAVRLFSGGRRMAVRAQDAHGQLWFTVCHNWDVYENGGFRRQFGIDPTQGLVKIAKACYSEGGQ